MIRRYILLGTVLGVLISLPLIIYLAVTPRIEALVISDILYNHNEVRHFTINDIPKGHVLSINIASETEVNAEFRREFPDDETRVEGFYNVDANTIWCVYDPLVLAHEIKHATEGAYHR